MYTNLVFGFDSEIGGVWASSGEKKGLGTPKTGISARELRGRISTNGGRGVFRRGKYYTRRLTAFGRGEEGSFGNK